MASKCLFTFLPYICHLGSPRKLTSIDCSLILCCVGSLAYYIFIDVNINRLAHAIFLKIRKYISIVSLARGMLFLYSINTTA